VPRAPNGYIVDGNRILDTAGNPVRLRGVALPNSIWDITGGPTTAGDFERMAGWGFNSVRIGLNQGFWLTGTVQCDSACYRTRVGELVGWARARDLDVILDLHFSTAGGAVPAQFMEMPDADSITFWQEVAALYAGDGRVLFELYNEPFGVGWDVWRAGGIVNGNYDPDVTDTDYTRPASITYQAAGMQALYEAVRSTGAHNLVIAGGINWAFDLSRIPEFGLTGYNLVYATHLYPFTGKLPADWELAFGFLRESVPLIISEFGPAATDGSCPDGYLDALFDYSDTNRLHWVAWAWFANGSPSDGRGGCTTDMFYAEADPLSPVYVQTPYADRLRQELQSVESTP
jgi:endoglucanase